MSVLLLTSQASTPADPETGKVIVFANNSDKLSSVDSSGLVTTFIDGPTAALVSNKSLDSTNKLVDSSDNTKVVQPDLSGMSSGVTLTVEIAQTTSQTLTVPSIREAEYVAIRPQTAYWSTAAPSGVTAGNTKMQGLSDGVSKITPQVTGNIVVQIVGAAGNTSATGTDTLTIRYGTGSGPANAAATTGTTVGSSVVLLPGVANSKVGFALQALITGLTIGTAIWIDVSLGAVTGTATIYTVDALAYEI